MRSIGIFGKKPIPGRVKTRLAASWGDACAAELYECFLRDQLGRFRAAGDRRIIGFAADAGASEWFAEAAAGEWQLWKQPETDLGGRMTRFFETYASEADDRTILIGSDSPSIPDEVLDNAWQVLETRDCVIGPASDGGYWLIGMRGRSTGHADLFELVDWSTVAVLRQTIERVRDFGLSLGLLPVWYDVDSIEGVSVLDGHLKAMATSGSPLDLPRTMAFLAALKRLPHEPGRVSQREI